MTVVDAIAMLLIGLAIADWGATVILVVVARRLPEPALQERAAASIILSLGASAVAVLAAAHLLAVALPSGADLVFLTIGLVLLSVPQLVWAAGYWLGKFR